MPAKVTEPPTGYEEIDRWAGGVGWIPHPEETMRRASHALATGEGVWLVDPLDAPGIDELITEFGAVRGVIVLSNYHARDADALARRHDVPVYLPAPMTGLAGRFEAPVGRVEVGATLGEYELFEVSRIGGFWQEYGLFDGETLVCADSVGGAPYMRVGDERLGVIPMRRLAPPRALRGLDPERVCCGHGSGVDRDAAASLERALRTSRRTALRALAENGPSQLRTVVAALRT
jgi:hypothetical protein